MRWYLQCETRKWSPFTTTRCSVFELFEIQELVRTSLLRKRSVCKFSLHSYDISMQMCSYVFSHCLTQFTHACMLIGYFSRDVQAMVDMVRSWRTVCSGNDFWRFPQNELKWHHRFLCILKLAFLWYHHSHVCTWMILNKMSSMHTKNVNDDVLWTFLDAFVLFYLTI